MWSLTNTTQQEQVNILIGQNGLKKACINIKNKDDKCFQYAFQCGCHKIYENVIQNFFTRKRWNMV